MYRVIVADDEPEFLEWFHSLLKDSEDFYIVGEATTGTEALRLITLLMPDLVIADVYMPDPDGVEVARYVAQHFPDIKSILISAQEERVYRDLAKGEGALTFIPKMRLSLNALRQALQVEG